MEKKLLACHVAFDAMSLFKLIDTNNYGFITDEDFQSAFGEKSNGIDLKSIISYMNVSEDSLVDRDDIRLTFVNFMKGLKPNQEFNMSS